MLVTALEIDGHEVDEAESAPAGLKRLAEARYHLVLSDYAMPGGTGAWMLHEATRLGLMGDAAALIITAYPEGGDLADIEVISKPIDLDFFLEQVRRVLASPRVHADAGEAANTPRIDSSAPLSSLRSRAKQNRT